MRARTPARSIKEDPGVIEENGSDIHEFTRIHRIHGTRGHGKAIFVGKEMVDVRLVTGVMSGSGVRKDQRVVDRTLE